MIPTKRDRRGMARDAILADPGKSDRALAEETGLCRGLLNRVRAELIRAGKVEPMPVTGRDGKTYRFPPRKGGPKRNRVDALAKRLNKALAVMQTPEFIAAWTSTPQSTRRRLAADAFRLNTEAARLRRLA